MRRNGGTRTRPRLPTNGSARSRAVPACNCCRRGASWAHELNWGAQPIAPCRVQQYLPDMSSLPQGAIGLFGTRSSFRAAGTSAHLEACEDKRIARDAMRALMSSNASDIIVDTLASWGV